MNLSLFERLNLKRDQNKFTMLRIQYRMHPLIAEFSNLYFYGSKLINGVQAKERESLLYKKNFFNEPIVFVNINGEDKKMKNENSYYNSEEAKIACYIVNALENDCGVKSKNIGIITPYIAQSNEIKKYLNPEQLLNIEVASVDSFQGKEKEYIIISTVRSNTRNNIGFLVDERRLNVMLTRAKFGMIIVGNIKTLLYAKEKTERRNSIRFVNKDSPTIFNYLVRYYDKKRCLVEWGKYEFKYISFELKKS